MTAKTFLVCSCGWEQEAGDGEPGLLVLEQMKAHVEEHEGHRFRMEIGST